MASAASEYRVRPHIVVVDTSVPRSNESRRRLLLPSLLLLPLLLLLSEFSSRDSNTSVTAELIAVVRMSREVFVHSLLPLLVVLVLVLVLILIVIVIRAVETHI